jgi:hypothetical protein
VPDNKKHHYVPKFYLRRFSATGQSINIYNIPGRRSIINGNLSNQCYNNRYYGPNPDIETALSMIEGESALVMATIDSSKRLPEHGAGDHLTLVSFLVFQAARTKASGEATDEMTDKIFKTAFQDDPRLEGIDLDGIAIGSQYPALLPLKVSADAIPLVMDLRLHLIMNHTAIEFMTSDNPVVLHNQYCERVRDMGATGWAQRGLQVFLPLSSNLLLFLYDGGVYKVADRTTGITEVCEQDAVAQLNALQWLNALENVYYCSTAQEAAVLAAAKKAIPKRNKTKVNLIEFVHERDEHHRLLTMHRQRLNISLDLPFCTLRRDSRRVPLFERIRVIRDPEAFVQWNNARANVPGPPSIGGRFVRKE